MKMKTTKNVYLSDCCNGPTFFVPPSLKEKGFYVCGTCNEGCKTHLEEVVTHTKISPGHYRPITVNTKHWKP